jgi:hypothetical protein
VTNFSWAIPYLPAHLGAHLGAHLFAFFAPHFWLALAAQDLPRVGPHFDIPDALHLPLHFGPQPAWAAVPESASAEAMAMVDSSERFFMKVSLVFLPKLARTTTHTRLYSSCFFPLSLAIQGPQDTSDIRGPGHCRTHLVVRLA